MSSLKLLKYAVRSIEWQSKVLLRTIMSLSCFLEQACGIVSGDNNHKLACSRLTPWVKQFSCSTINAFIDSLIKGNLQYQIEAMIIKERYGYPFELLESLILGRFSAKITFYTYWVQLVCWANKPIQFLWRS